MHSKSKVESLIMNLKYVLLVIKVIAFNKAKGQISKRVLQENIVCQIFRKMIISYLLIGTLKIHTFALLPVSCQIISAVRCVKYVPIQSFLWSAFLHIQIRYGNLHGKSLYSVQIWENRVQEKLRMKIDCCQNIKYQ